MQAYHMATGTRGEVTDVRTRWGYGDMLWARWAGFGKDGKDWRPRWTPLTSLCVDIQTWAVVAHEQETLRDFFAGRTP